MMHPWNLKLPDWYFCDKCNAQGRALWRARASRDLRCGRCLKNLGLDPRCHWDNSFWMPGVPIKADEGWFGTQSKAICIFRTNGYLEYDPLWDFWLHLPMD